MNKLSKNEKWFLIICLVLLLFGLVKHFYDQNTKNEILKKYNVTIGFFVDYDKVGDARTPYISYFYEVNKKKYYRQVLGTNKYDYCYKNSKCKSLKFWVIYSKKDYSKSLIDLSVEIQNITNSEFPERLDNFK